LANKRPIKDNDNHFERISDLLKLTVEKRGSDLHLLVGLPPLIRVNGELEIQDYPSLEPGDIEKLLYPLLEDFQRERLEKDLELDFSITIDKRGHFRGNVMRQRGTLSVVFRAVPFEIPYIDDLGLPQEIKKLCYLPRGLVLVTGPTGSGKSTTLASMIDHINDNRHVNVVTVEDPLEFLHIHKKATVRQREIGRDTHSYNAALRHVLRADPDVILIGEMRDLESISIALTAAETGHLVLSTLHTQTAPLTISRVVNAFQADRRDQVRQQLANSLKGVISQQLLPRGDHQGRRIATEFMVNTLAVRSLIREGKEHQIYSVIQTGHSSGMQTMDQSLAKLYKEGAITREKALEYCVEEKELERLLGSPGTGIACEIHWKE